MNCEQVEERLSAYLDNMLAPDERRTTTIHLQACPHCMMLLAELRQHDILLAQLPRVHPSAALHERIFSAPEMRELARLFVDRVLISDEQTQPLEFMRQQAARERIERLQLVSLPGGRAPQTPAEEIPSTRLQTSFRSSPISGAHRKKRLFTPWKIAVAALLIVTLGTAGLFSLSLRKQATSSNIAGAITPPAAGPASGQTLPLAAGTRFVFWRAGALWSTLVDGNGHQPERLTPSNITVGAGWVVSPTLAGHVAGDVLAYIDVQRAEVHTVRSDGQRDTSIPQVLLQTGTQAASVWKTTTGQTILSSLAWSNNGNMLAFVGDPSGSGQTNLYLYSTTTNKVQEVTPDLTGSIAHPVWSLDDTRLAFTLTHNGVVSILDYNMQNQGTLDLSNLATAQGDSTNSVLTLGWSPSASAPAVTWSLGTSGQISSVWIHRVGVDSTLYPQRLAGGEYLQALYSPRAAHDAGSWLLLTVVAGHAVDIWRVDLTPGAGLVPLSSGKQVSFARWSPDGSSVFYLDRASNGVGSGHLVNALTGADEQLSNAIAVDPAPDWSADNQQLAYSSGTQITIANALNGSQVIRLNLHGPATALAWSPSTAHQLIVAFGAPTPGLYLVDTLHNTSSQLDHLGSSDQGQWTAIP